MMKKAVIFAIITISLFTYPIIAETITVDDDGPADFSTIQEAINYSWHGDVIEVQPGTYTENIFFNGRAIVLTSTNPNDPNVLDITIIDGSVGFDFSEGVDSVITGFKIESSITCLATSPTITKNNFRGISASHDSAPLIMDNTITGGVNGCNGTIESNEITGRLHYCDGTINNNVISSTSHGLSYCDGTISDNVISYCGGSGLFFCDATVSNNVISNNSDNGLEGCHGTIDNNIISENTTYGLDLCNGDITDNTISYNSSGLYRCNGTISDNIIEYNGKGVMSCNTLIEYNIVRLNSYMGISHSCGLIRAC